MFRIVGLAGELRECYGCFVDECGVVQFIIDDGDGLLVATNSIEGYWTIMKKGGAE